MREKQGRYSALQPDRKACLELPAVRSRRGKRKRLEVAGAGVLQKNG